MTHSLSAAQINFFNDHGYLIIRSLAGTAEVTQLRQLAEQDLAARQDPLELEADVQYPGAPANRSAPGGDTVRRLLEAYRRHPEFASWAGDPRITGRLQVLFGEQDIFLVQSHHNCVMTKHPRYSSETHWHQDARYWAYTESNLISVWLALGFEEQANGGMQLIPGTHNIEFDEQRYDPEKFLHTDLQENQELIQQAVLAELEPGDALFFHARLFHAAGRNQTAKRKFALVYTYRSAGNPPLPDSKSTRLPEISL